MWKVDTMRAARPKKHGGWGGYGPLDQQLCLAISGIERRLLPPLPASVALDPKLFDRSDSLIAQELRQKLPPMARSTLLGCFVDAKQARDLGSHQGVVSAHADCFRRCRVARLPFAGLQFGQECWCGLAYGQHGRAPLADCNMTCGQQQCGGPSRNLIFDLRPNLADD